MRKRRPGLILTIVLIALITVSVAQAGILWSIQLKGNASGGSSSSGMNDQTAIDELFKPYNIILSSGNGDDKLIISPANKDYADLWSEAVTYIKNAYSVKSTLLETDEWIQIYSESAYIFEFRTNIKTDILAWFLGVNKLPGSEITGVYKLALLYDQEDTKNMTVYLLDDAHVHMFLIPYLNRDREYFKNVMLANYKAQDSVPFGFFPGALSIPTRDALLVSGMKNDLIAKFNPILMKVPDNLVITDNKDPMNQRNIAGALLSNERYSYETDVTKAGILTIANLNSIYTLDSSGYLEYESKTAGEVSPAKGNLRDAFINAIKFIYDHNRRALTSKVNIYISDIIENKDTYTFIFNYRVSGAMMVPVYIDYQADINGAFTKVSDAVRIESTGAALLSAKWLLRQVDKLPGEVEMNLKPDIAAFNELIVNNYARIYGTESDGAAPAAKDIRITDINPAYMLTAVDRPSGIRPIWAIAVNLSEERYLYGDEAQ
jgi:hypothetical protein